jgi:Gluconate 2-dehydrogenase subunit 3
MKDNELTRRQAVGLAAGVALSLAGGERWVFAARDGQVVKASGDPAAAWRPVLLNEREGQALARLVEALIPRTGTPGARDARVHEYVDLAVSLEPAPQKKVFVDGLRWLDRRCRRSYGGDLVAVGDADLIELLRSVSDEHAEHPKALRPGARFFAGLKRRTIFGYYTSLEGRVEELGLPDTVSMQNWRGCTHQGKHEQT